MRSIPAASTASWVGSPGHDFCRGLEVTERWYLDHLYWCSAVRQRAGYAGERIGQARSVPAAS